MLRIWKSSWVDFVLIDFVNLLYLKINPQNDLLLYLVKSNLQHQFLSRVHYKIFELLEAIKYKTVKLSAIKLWPILYSESLSWVNLPAMIPNLDCHWNLSNLVDLSSSLLAHILFYLIDFHNLLMVLGMTYIGNIWSLPIMLKPSWVTRKISRSNSGNRWKWFVTISRGRITRPHSKTYHWTVWYRWYGYCSQDDF